MQAVMDDLLYGIHNGFVILFYGSGPHICLLSFADLFFRVIFMVMG